MESGTARQVAQAQSAFWKQSGSDIAGNGSEWRAGLSSLEVERRTKLHGPNVIVTDTNSHVIVKLVRRFLQPLVLVLLVASVISGLSGDLASSMIILIIVGVSTGLDVVQEQGAERAAAALRQSIAIRVEALRDGEPADIPVEQLVPGDVVRLGPGDLVPADGLVLMGHGGRVNEALLTGEPYPVDKRPGPSGANDPSAAFDALFGGTAVVSGELLMLVAATGPATTLGAVAASLQSDAPPTAFERGLHRLGLVIVKLTIALVLFVLLAHIAFHRPPLESFMFAVALAVGLTPELLPMVTTVTLARGAVRMAGRKVIVKKLSAIHDLGAMDVLCTDKTGTLTEARIELSGRFGLDGKNSDHVLDLAAVNSRHESGVGNPLDEAILARAGDLGKQWQKLADLPFDFERRMASVTVRDDGRRMLIVKGAPEAVLARCNRAQSAQGGVVPLDAALRAQCDVLHDDKAGQGLRLLGVAWREWDGPADTLRAEDERDLIFAGYCAFLDPPKASASAAIARLRRQNVRVKIISGDAAAVVRHLVTALSLDCSNLLTGEEIAALSQAELQARVRDTDLFARVSPDQKLRIIHALSAMGHTVGFLGDGINDAPAIRAADAGISVESATDVARAAADLVLLAPDLGVLADGVEEGRRTYANIMKYLRMGTSSNFGNMLSMALASLVIPFLPMTAIQILLNNLLYDLSEIGIPFDAVDEEDLRSPHNWSMPALLRFTGVMGPLSSIFDLATFGLLLWVYHAGQGAFRTAWFLESILTQILVIFVIRTRRLPWQSRAHRALVFTSLGSLAVALVLALGPVGSIFGFVSLPASLLLWVGGLALAYLILAQTLKRLAID